MDLPAQLRSALAAQNLPAPSDSFLASLIAARSPPPPLNALTATARARLLAGDLTSPIIASSPSSSAALLPAAAGPDARELRLPAPVHVQVLDVENLSLSRWEQIEELEAVARGERTRGREIVRVVDEEDEAEDNASASGGTRAGSAARGGTAAASTSASANGTRAAGKGATHRLVLQDARGTKVFAVELRRIDGIGIGRTNIGEKMLLRAGTVIARGTVLLDPEHCVLLGGKVEAWQKVWSDGRLARLKEAAGTRETT